MCGPVIETEAKKILNKGKAIGEEVGKEIGREIGEDIKLLTLIIAKVKKKKSLAQIADELEETTDGIQGMYDAVMENPDKTAEEIYNLLHKEENI